VWVGHSLRLRQGKLCPTPLTSGLDFGQWLSLNNPPKPVVILRDFSPEGSGAHNARACPSGAPASRQMLRKLSVTPWIVSQASN
jgi:hypothetical protein